MRASDDNQNCQCRLQLPAVSFLFLTAPSMQFYVFSASNPTLEYSLTYAKKTLNR